MGENYSNKKIKGILKRNGGKYKSLARFTNPLTPDNIVWHIQGRQKIIKKPYILIILSILHLIYPAIHLFDSIHYMNNAIEAEARIVSYDPKMDLKAGGMMEIRDVYMADYDGHVNSFVLGIRTVKMKNMKEEMKKALPFKPGDTFQILYLPGKPERRIQKPQSRLLFNVYNSSNNAPLLYLLKLGSVVLFFFSIVILIRRHRGKCVERQ